MLNLSDQPAQGRVRLPWPELDPGTWVLTGLLDGERYSRSGTELTGPGLFVGLDAWGTHVLAVGRDRD